MDSLENILEKSRSSRLALVETNKSPGKIQQFFRRGFLGWLTRTLIQSIPSPIAEYGLGDLVTGISAVKGKDILTGEKLDKTDRVLFIVATLIPYVPATILVGPLHLVRRYIEDLSHSHQKGEANKSIEHFRGLIKSVKDLIVIIGKAGKK